METEPLASGPINVVNLVSLDDSKITHVSLYTGRAEVTRLYAFSVKAGQNQVVISGLPSILDQQSLRYVDIAVCFNLSLIE
jgi:hypothetical protein